MYQIVIWGTGSNYQRLINLIKFYEEKCEFSVIGVTSEDDFFEFWDGYKYISKEELDWKFDYIIATPEDFQSVIKEVEEIGGDINKLIPGKVLQLPGFSFNRYIELKKNIPTIISRDCYGATLYNALGLPFLSPTILLWFDDENYIRFLSNFSYYIKSDLEYVKSGKDEVSGLLYPICKLGDILIHFNHYSTFEEAKKKWDERVQRIDWNNIIVFNQTSNVEKAKEFMRLPFEKKYIFTNFECDNCFNCEKIINSTGLTLGRIGRRSCVGNYRLYNPIEILL